MYSTAILASVVLAVFVETAVAGPVTFARFDKNHLTISFEVPILGGISSVAGQFMEYSITVEYDPTDPTTTSILAVIPVGPLAH